MVDPRDVLDVLERAVIVTDPAGHILLWNRAAEGFYGWPEHEVLGRSILDVLAPPQQAETDAADLALLAGGTSKTGDRIVVGRDGIEIRVHTFTSPMVDEQGDVVAIVGSSEDVGERRLQEQEARDLSEHFRSALAAGGLGTWRWDIASGETVWDAHMEQLFGLEPGGFDGSFETYVSLLHPEDGPDVLANITEAVRTKSSYRVEHRVVHPDESVRWIGGVGGVTTDEFGRVIGMVGCSMDVTDRVLQESELRRLTEMAERAAESERLQRERLEFLASINTALSRSSTIAELMENVTRQAVPRLGDWCAMHVVTADGRGVPEVVIAHVDEEMERHAREVHHFFPWDPEASSGVPAVIRSGRTEFIPEISPDLLAASDLTPKARKLVTRLDLGSAITVAMKKRSRVVGALQFIATNQSRRYTSDDVALAETVAARIASSIENLRLHDEQREIARTLERSLLPSSLPEVPGVDVAVRYWPNGEVNEVGGDFYDLFALETDGRFALVLGDVCGTGPSAAALTGLARHTIRDSAWHDDGHEGVLHSLNRAVRRSGYHTFLTCVYGTIDTTSAATTLTVTCGGHPLPTLVRDGEPSPIGLPGRLLGCFDDTDVHPTTIELLPGDVIVFHTDGATDVIPPNGLDEDEWRAVVAEAARRGGGAEEIADSIKELLGAILPFEERNDDIALLVSVVGGGRSDKTEAATT